MRFVIYAETPQDKKWAWGGLAENGPEEEGMFIATKLDAHLGAQKATKWCTVYCIQYSIEIWIYQPGPSFGAPKDHENTRIPI